MFIMPLDFFFFLHKTLSAVMNGNDTCEGQEDFGHSCLSPFENFPALLTQSIPFWDTAGFPYMNCLLQFLFD